MFYPELCGTPRLAGLFTGRLILLRRPIELVSGFNLATWKSRLVFFSLTVGNWKQVHLCCNYNHLVVMKSTLPFWHCCFVFGISLTCLGCCFPLSVLPRASTYYFQVHRCIEIITYLLVNIFNNFKTPSFPTHVNPLTPFATWFLCWCSLAATHPCHNDLAYLCHSQHSLLLEPGASNRGLLDSGEVITWVASDDLLFCSFSFRHSVVPLCCIFMCRTFLLQKYTEHVDSLGWAVPCKLWIERVLCWNVCLSSFKVIIQTGKCCLLLRMQNQRKK